MGNVRIVDLPIAHKAQEQDIVILESGHRVFHKVTIGEIADTLKRLLSDRGVESVIVLLPTFDLEVKRIED